MHRKRGVQQDTQENAMHKQKQTNQENEPKMLAKSSKIALEIETGWGLGGFVDPDVH